MDTAFVAENKSYGKPGDTFEGILGLAKDANARNVILGNLDGYDTMVGKHLALLNGKGEAIVTVVDMNDLPFGSQVVVKEELRRRYLTATVEQVIHAKFEYGSTYWSVGTDRGQRDFVTQHLQENAIWLSDTHLLLLDVDGNRFEVQYTDALSVKSQESIRSIL